MTTSLFDHHYRALVIGASGAIGRAFGDALGADPQCLEVRTLSRSGNPGFDITHADSIAQWAQSLASGGPYHCIVDATGALMLNGRGPEKSLAALEPGQLARAFEVNAIGPVMVLRHFAPLLAPGPSIYAKLSARVGSISDNRKGGWYGYRASKAALNMLLHTAAIELQRKQPELRVIALQPGTVASPLSAPFVAGHSGTLSAETSVRGMLSAMRQTTACPGALFIDYQGHPIGW